MWKLILGFAVFAALAIYLLTRPGAEIDLTGEKHEVAAPGASAALENTAPAAPAPAPAPTPAASQ